MEKEIAIKVENIGKKYSIGEKEQYFSLRESITNAIKLPYKILTGKKPLKKPDFWALKNVSFEVKKGEVIGIIGRNGAGKSTLLKILSKITDPTTGQITINGRVSSLLEVGTGFHPELTGRENIYLNGAILGMTKKEIKEKFNDIVEFSGIEKFLDTPVKKYSSGMYVRLAFAVAAHLEPEILIVDEVLAVGDAEFQKKCLGKMKDVASSGRTVLFVSHNMDAIENMCSSCILIEDGNIKYNSINVKKVIHLYLNKSKKIHNSEWKNSKREYDNPWFKPSRFAIVDKQGQTIKTNDDSSDCYIRVEGYSKLADSRLQLGYAIYNEDYQLLYWSLHDDLKEEYWPKMNKGFNVLQSKIPKEILRVGVYRFELIARLFYTQWICNPEENGTSIYMSILTKPDKSKYNSLEHPGILFPLLTWAQIK